MKNVQREPIPQTEANVQTKCQKARGTKRQRNSESEEDNTEDDSASNSESDNSYASSEEENDPEEDDGSTASASAPQGGPDLHPDFLQVPTDNQVKTYYKAVYNATSNEGVAMFVCSVCARELDV